MSRSFDPTAGADSITFSPGAAPPDQGPITVAVLAKAASTAGWTGWMISGRTTGAVWGFLTSNNAGAKLYAENDFGTGVAGLSTSWRWYVMTKATGSALPRIHVWDLSTAWSHTNNTSNVADGTGPITTLIVGSNGTNGWRGSIACIAAWDTVLSDATIEATMTLKASDVLAGSPKWMIRLNQSSTATGVTDDTAGGGNQTAISGTTIDADDPPGFNYSLSAAQSISPTGIAVPAALGQPTIAQSLAVAPTGIAVPVALGQPTIAQSFTLSPSGIAVPVALGQPTVSQSLGGTISPTGIAVPVAVGMPTVSGPAYNALQQGSWWELETMLETTRTQMRWWNTRQPVACPNDGEPLRRSVDGILYCPFDNWRPDGQIATPRRRAINRDWGHLSGIKQAAAQDAVFNTLILSCPNDGEPLSIGKHGEQFCRYDGWMPPDQAVNGP